MKKKWYLLFSFIGWILLAGLLINKPKIKLTVEAQDASVSGQLAIPTKVVINPDLLSGASAERRRSVSIKSKVKAIYGSKERIETELINVDANTVETVLKNDRNEEVKAEVNQIDNQGVTSLAINPPLQFKPGKYFLKITDQTGYSIEQNFLWGVLAINPNKSVYRPGETANLAMAVLDEAGNMVCNAKLVLKITDPLGSVAELSTTNGKITVNPECQSHGYTLKPDYAANFKVEKNGHFDLELESETSRGSFTISDGFDGAENIDYDVERVSATRIYPPLIYPMMIKIVTNKDFTGSVYEEVPSSFELSQPDKNEGEKYSGVDEGNSKKKINWKVNLKKGDGISLGYRYKAPSISPQFYLTGPLRLATLTDLVYQEPRFWQIAADAIQSYTSGSGYWTAPISGSATIELHGGGGGGGYGGTVNKYGGGGAGGGQAVLVTFNATVGTTYAYTVGVGGSGGTSTHKDGYTGGDTTFVINGSTKIAKGGGYGGQFSGSGGTGGIGSTVGGVGDTVYAGGYGAPGTTTYGGGGGGGAGSTGTGVMGWNSSGGAATPNNGGVGGSGSSLSAGVGGIGGNYGGGGGGGTKNSNGGNGGGGYILITYPDSTPINISGLCKQFDEATNCAVGETVRYAVGATLIPSTTTISGGTWVFTGQSMPSNGSTVTTYIAGVGVSQRANSVTKYAAGGSDLTGIMLYENHLTIGNSGGNISIGNSDLAIYDNAVAGAGSSEVFFDVDVGNTLNTDVRNQFAQEKLYVYPGNEFKPGGNVIANNLLIGGTLTSTAGTVLISGNFVNNGIFNPNSGTINFNPTTNSTIGGSGAVTFDYLTIGGSGVTTLLGVGNSMIVVNKNVAVNSGATLDFGSQSIGVSGAITTAGSGAITCTVCTAGGLNLSGSGADPWCSATGSVTCDGNWTARRKIKFDTTSVAGTVTNMPVLVKLNKDRIDYTKTKTGANGADLRFIDPSNTAAVLPFEVESWNPNTTDSTVYSYVWVKVPQIVGASTSGYIYMYYGNTSTSESVSALATQVWSDNYLSVYHLDEGVGTSTLDSSTSPQTGTLVNTPTWNTSSMIGTGITLNGTSQTINLQNPSKLGLNYNQQQSYSAWIKTSVDANQTIFEKKLGASPYTGYGMMTGTGGYLYFQMIDSYSTRTLEVRNTTALGVGNSTWHHVEMTYDGSNAAAGVKIYFDGSQVATTTTINNVPLTTTITTANGCIGSRNATNQYFSGALDEIRVSGTVRSADYVKEEYLTETDTLIPSGTGWGSEEANTSSGLGGGSGAITFYNLTFSGLATTSNINTANIGVLNNLTIGSSRTVVAPSGSLTIGGSFTNNGTFTPGGGTVVLNNSANVSTLSYAAATNFNNLTITTAGKEVDFDSNSTHQTNIGGTLSVNGAGCGTPVKLYSNAAPTQYKLNVTGTASVQYASIINSNAIVALTASNSTGSNNINWTINGGVCVGGTAVPTLDQLMRHGEWFSSNVRKPFTF